MSTPSLRLIISFSIIIFLIYAARVSNSQSVANLSTTWILNGSYYDPSIDTQIHIVLSPSSSSPFISCLFCSLNETSCFFGILIVGGRGQDQGARTDLIDPKIVWLANRDRPVGVNATLKLTSSGDLRLEDADGDIVWSTNTTGKSVMGLNFTDIGNLVVFDSNNETVWQSFDHPTDSLLVGQKLVSDSGQKLIAGKSSSDFSPGLYSVSVRNGSLFGYFGADLPLVYYESTLESLKKEYFALEEGLTIGYHTIPLESKAQFMRLEPDGRLKLYEWWGAEWKPTDLLTFYLGYKDDCGYPMACGQYSTCSWNGQYSTWCRCSGNDTGIFRQVSRDQPNLGCSLVTPISCDHSQNHSLLELKNTTHFSLYNSKYNGFNQTVSMEDCKKACLRNCSCKAALFLHESYDSTSRRGCLLLSEVFSLINDDGGYNNVVFLKVQNFPTKEPWSQAQNPPPKQSWSPRRSKIILGSSLGALFSGCLLVGSCILVSKMKRKPEELDEFSVDEVLGMPTRFSYNYLKTATDDFNNKLGEGGFGTVFQGTLSDGTKVAVKRLAGLSQIKKSFLAEVRTIGSIHHVNLVRLIGFCAENTNRLLVYEYMSNGSLDRWIYKRHQEITLGWESRRKIITDIAKGLAYLHEECRQRIYHLDVKPQNILLDENFEAKVSDFGLAKLIDKDQSRVVATFGGTPGYMAPEWLSSIITEKVDVYSFGVVVLEILCGRKNLDKSQPEEEMHLLALLERKGAEGKLLDMVDKYNADMQLHGAEVEEMMKLAVWCLQSDYQSRPSMTVVVQVLEGFLSVQDDLDFNFVHAAARRTIATIGDDMNAVRDGTVLLASVLSGPR